MMDQRSTLKLNSSQTDIHRRPSAPLPMEDLPVASHPLLSSSSESAIADDKPAAAPYITETTIQIIGCICGWYAFSLTISLYNKWMFDKTQLNFPFPILITSFHQLLLSLLSLLAITLKPSLRPRRNEEQQGLPFYMRHILPCSLASAGDIGAGNASFRFISLTTYTMVKSSSIAFVLLFGVITRLEKFSSNLLGIVLLMSAGVMLMVDTSNTGSKDGTDSTFMLGFFLVLLSSCMSGVRWVFTQLLLHKNQSEVLQVTLEGNKKRVNPIYTIYQLSPPMFLALFVVGCGVEGFGNFLHAEIWQEKGVAKSIALLLFPGFLVLFMTMFEFGILQRAQVITLSIAGILKELLTIVASTFIFHDRLTPMNIVGLLITIVDIVWYNIYRYSEKKREEEDRLAASKTTEFELGNV